MERAEIFRSVFSSSFWTVIFCPEVIDELAPEDIKWAVRERASHLEWWQELICVSIPIYVGLFKTCEPWIHVSYKNTTQQSLQQLGLHISWQLHDMHIVSWHIVSISSRANKTGKQNPPPQKHKRGKGRIPGLHMVLFWLPRTALDSGHGVPLSYENSSHMLTQPAWCPRGRCKSPV